MLEWLRGFGVIFEPERVHVSGVGSVPRGHAPAGEGLAVVDALDRERIERGVDLVLKTRVDDLLRASDGRVIGASAAGEQVRTGATILASGGFGNNPEFIGRHFPDAAAAGDWTWYIGSPMALGDGIALGQRVGATLDGHNRGLLLMTPGFSRDLEIFLPGWLILVNREGRRFVDETAPYTVMAGLVKRHGGVAFAIFDEPARAAAHPNLLFQAYWVDEVLEAKAREGRIIRAETLEELSRRAGIDADALAGTIERYNEDCESGVDSAFFKNPISGMRPIATPPFYAVEVRPAIIAWTGAGLRIDAETRVIGADERPIPGLFAAGETVGSIHGDRYIGGGGSFGPCIAFGKLAGENAAAAAAASESGTVETARRQPGQ
jgi:fumarate reductase flavoprotein subunit